MRKLFLISLASALLASPIGAVELPAGFETEPGTYRTETVTSFEDCETLCRSDEKCRGMQALQPDTRKPEMICFLNDGLSSGSTFTTKPPKPLDLDVALADFNAYRAEHGLKPVTLDKALIAASEIHSEDLSDMSDLSHTGSDGSSHSERAERAGYQYTQIAENVAAGQKSWPAVFKAWQDSPGHNANLLLPDVTDFGVAIVYDPESTYVTSWTMLVGRPLK